MLDVKFSMSFPSLTAVAAFVQSLHDRGAPVTELSLGTIAYADRPDVGVEQVLAAGGSPIEPVAAPVVQSVTAADANAVFGGAVAPVVPTPPAPSTAAVAASPTAPAAPPAPATVATTPSAPVPPAPPLAPAATAPSAPAAPANPAGVVLDTKGLPWDTRIHAETRATVADGSWRRKRNTAPELIASVEAELRQALAVPGVVPPAPPAPPAAGAPAVAAAPAPITAGELMARLAPFMADNRISNTTVACVLGKYQLANLWQLIQRPDLVPSISADFDAEIAKLSVAA